MCSDLCKVQWGDITSYKDSKDSVQTEDQLQKNKFCEQKTAIVEKETCGDLHTKKNDTF